MNDIQNRNDLEKILTVFYDKLLEDNQINYIFTDVAKIDLKSHIPVITDFWEQSLFRSGGYKNNVLQIHADLNRKSALTEAHFNHWLMHFDATINSLFAGKNAEMMKTRALSISTIMKMKLL